MELIAISKDVLINPDQISTMRYVTMGNGRTLVITVAGEQHIVEFPLNEVYAKLIKAGMKSNDQYFAG